MVHQVKPSTSFHRPRLWIPIRHPTQFLIFRLNTDLHSPSMRKEKRMSEEDFIKNLSGINNGNDLDQTMLSNIYNRVKKSEFKANDDHINQVKWGASS